MAELQKLQKLSAPKCVLLAVEYAANSNITALRALTALRESDFELELVLRILLTYLPESADPTTFIVYVHELASDVRTPGNDPAASLDISLVDGLSNSQAQRKRRNLELVPLIHALYKSEAELSPLNHFLIHRAHRVDAATGLLNLIPPLIILSMRRSEYMRKWLISTVLPLLRLSHEYYPQNSVPSLDEFAQMRGKRAIECLLSNLRISRGVGMGIDNAARDLRSIVAPWLCGANDRKRRQLSVEDRRASVNGQQTQEPDDWECLFDWIVHTSKEDFPLASSVIMHWDGPEDMDFGGYNEGRDYVGDETRRRLELRYAQTALACLYLVEKSDPDSIQAVHSLLIRISDLLNFDPPPDLNVGVESLPSYDLDAIILHKPTTSILQDNHILRPENAITQPNRNAVRLLELFVFSVCLFSNLEHPMSVREVARLYIRNDSSEQFSLLQKILHTLSSGSKKDGDQWKNIRSKLLWLWNWGTDKCDNGRYAQGLFGKIEIKTVETEILKAFLDSSHYQLAIKIYIQSPSGQNPLSPADIENVVLISAMHYYDNASNGNRTRGGMKRASDIVAAFNPYFRSSTRFQRTEALLSATHAMSFYSLTLQHGVPFQPVNIRVGSDPLSLLQKLLSQNSKSYTHLDDLIFIGQNLVISSPSTIMDEKVDPSLLDPAAIEQKKAVAERRIIGMAIEAALEQDDFETAYSYVVNRLSPPEPSPAISPSESVSSQRFSFGSFDSAKHHEDGEDVSWRAALQAGRHQSSPSSSKIWSQTGITARPDLRRLEQRMELLSQALLLAPPRHLEEVLSVWQQCETELNTLLAEETEAEERFNDAADRRLPGAFTNETTAVQPRREVGRGAVEEAPMGLFDVARGAAAAFSKSAFPLRGNTQSASRNVTGDAGDQSRVSMDLSDSGSMHAGEDRVRKRDMVASAVTGGLASGIGWVLGAKPVQDRDSD